MDYDKVPILVAIMLGLTLMALAGILLAYVTGRFLKSGPEMGEREMSPFVRVFAWPIVPNGLKWILVSDNIAISHDYMQRNLNTRTPFVFPRNCQG
ncbi:MAG: hypothetical protein ACREPW_04110, partial [Candidatus Binataceae bacterium]